MLLPAVALGVFLVPGPAEAAFPGQNGKIAYNNGGDIWIVDPDGTGATQITTHPAPDLQPDWSPDGTEIAFMSTRDDPNPPCTSPCRWEIYVMNADGTDVRRVTNFGTTNPGTVWPAWSPDGTRIAYARNNHLWTIVADGTDERRVTLDHTNPDCFHVYGHPITWSPDGTELTDSGESFCFDHIYPERCFVNVATGVTQGCRPNDGEGIEDWSPDSQHVLVGTDGVQNGLYRTTRTGSGFLELTEPNQAYDGYFGNAAWSPDGTTIIYRHDPYAAGSSLYLIDAGGGNQRPFQGPHIGCCYDWQSIPVTAYPRPKSATPMQVSLVPGYEVCTSPNRTHGPPLAFGSCNPPQPRSSALTIGTPDANGQAPKSQADVWLRVLPGNPATPADEADVRLSGSITDVRLASDLSDYTGGLEARVTLRITDKDNTPDPAGAGVATVEDLTYSFPISCAATSDTTVGGACAFDTTADALVPGTARERTRAIWELGAVRVHDEDGGPFLTQGVFVP